MCGGGKITTGYGWWYQNYDWSWVVVTKLWLVMGGGHTI